MLSISERQQLAHEQKNVVEAFALANHYKSLFLEHFKTNTEGGERRKVVSMNIDATNWLAHGLEFKKSTNTDLINYINLDDFFYSLDHVRGKILYCDANLSDKKLLLDALIKNKTIVALIIEREKDLNDFVTELLKSTRSITKIIMRIEVNTKLSPQFISQLAEILKSNSSIKEIDFGSGNTISTGNFKVILDALAVNPNSKLTTLEGQRIAIHTDEAAQLLINYLQNHHQLEYVQPWHYQGISADNYNLIKSLFELNKDKKQKAKGDFITESTQRFFAQLGFHKDIGNIMRPYLDIKDAFNLSLVSKKISKETKDEQTQAIDNLTPKM